MLFDADRHLLVRRASGDGAARTTHHAPRPPIRPSSFRFRQPQLFWLGLVAALALSVPAWLPSLGPQINLWEVDDAKNHMIRLYHLQWLIQHGVWYPRWVPDLFLGYGYPLFNFYAPGFYYFALSLKALLRLDFWDTFRASAVAATLIGVGGSYALVVALWRRVGPGIVAATMLAYGPYVFGLNLYKRGDVPEMLALALIPWLLLAIWCAWTTTGPAAIAWSAAVAAIAAAQLLTHNLTALLSAVVAGTWVLYLLLRRFDRGGLARVAAAALVAAGVTAFFWLPALAESRLVHLEDLGTGDLDYRSWLLDPAGNTSRQQKPDNPQTRTGLIDTHLHYPMQLVAAPKLSLAQAAAGALALAVVAIRMGGAIGQRTSPPGPLSREERGNGAREAGGLQPLSCGRGVAEGRGEVCPAAALVPLLVLAGVCWYLTFTWSAWAWAHVPGLPLLQFPWRLHGPLGILLAIAGGGALAFVLPVVERREGALGRVASLGIVALAVGGVLFNGLGARGFQVKEGVSRTVDATTVLADERQDHLGMGTTTGREFLPREVYIATYTQDHPRGREVFDRLYPEADWSGGVLYPLAGDLRLLNWRSEPLRLSARVANDGTADAAIAIRQTHFAGWRGWLDGKPVPVTVAPYVPEQQTSPGFLVLAVPPGEHTITAAFGPTRSRLLGMAVTLATALVVAGAAAWYLRQVRSPKSEVRSRLGRGFHDGLAQGWLRGWPSGALVAGWVAVALVAGSFTWRGVRPAIGRFAALPVPEARAADGVWRALDVGGGRGGMLVNLAEAVRTHQARIESPSGATLGPNQYVDVRQLVVTDTSDPDRGAPGTSRREWLFLHPPSQVSVTVELPAGGHPRLQAGLALDPASWETRLGDGVEYQALVAPLDADGRAGEPSLLLARTVNPRANREERKWLPVEVDLSPWRGKRVQLTLRTLPRDDLNYDWAGWGNPVVSVLASDRIA